MRKLVKSPEPGTCNWSAFRSIQVSDRLKLELGRGWPPGYLRVDFHVLLGFQLIPIKIMVGTEKGIIELLNSKRRSPCFNSGLPKIQGMRLDPSPA